MLPDFIVDFFNIEPIILSWEVREPAKEWGWTFYVDFIQLISFNFIRLSEFQELLFNFYIISHVYYLEKFLILNRQSYYKIIKINKLAYRTDLLYEVEASSASSSVG